MRATKFGHNMVLAVLLFLMVGLLHTKAVTPAREVQEYIRFALTTDFDFSILLDEARALEAFSERVKWSKLVGVMALRLSGKR